MPQHAWNNDSNKYADVMYSGRSLVYRVPPIDHTIHAAGQIYYNGEESGVIKRVSDKMSNPGTNAVIAVMLIGVTAAFVLYLTQNGIVKIPGTKSGTDTSSSDTTTPRPGVPGKDLPPGSLPGQTPALDPKFPNTLGTQTPGAVPIDPKTGKPISLQPVPSPAINPALYQTTGFDPKNPFPGARCSNSSCTPPYAANDGIPYSDIQNAFGWLQSYMQQHQVSSLGGIMLPSEAINKAAVFEPDGWVPASYWAPNDVYNLFMASVQFTNSHAVA